MARIGIWGETSEPGWWRVGAEAGVAADGGGGGWVSRPEWPTARCGKEPQSLTNQQNLFVVMLLSAKARLFLYQA